MAFSMHGPEIAAVVVEPVAGNMGVVPPSPGFLELLRDITTRHGALLVFDEVITGYRSEEKSCQAVYGVEADIICLGKIIGGGLPVGAFGGRKEIMEQVAPAGAVFQAGTFSGNLLGVSAGHATLQALDGGDVYPQMESLGSLLEEGLNAMAEKHAVPIRVQRFHSMLSVHFTGDRVTDYSTATKADFGSYRIFFHEMLERGVYIPPSPLEAWFLSGSHSVEDMARIIDAADGALEGLRRKR